MTSWRPIPTPYFPNKLPVQEARRPAEEHVKGPGGKWVPTPGEGPTHGALPPAADRRLKRLQRNEQIRAANKAKYRRLARTPSPLSLARPAVRMDPMGPRKEAAAAPGPRIYAGRRRLRVEPTGETGRYRLVDSEGAVRFEGPQSAVEHHIGEQLRRGRYKALR